MVTDKERFDLFISYMKDKTLLTPDKIQDVEKRLENCPTYISNHTPNEIDRLINSGIFKDGKIKGKSGTSNILLPIENPECFINQILFAMLPFKELWLNQYRENIEHELIKKFNKLSSEWASLKSRLLCLGLMRKDIKAFGHGKGSVSCQAELLKDIKVSRRCRINLLSLWKHRKGYKPGKIKPQKDNILKELSMLRKEVFTKLTRHNFPKGSIEGLEEMMQDDRVDHLIYIFQTNLPLLEDKATAYRISELLSAFDMPAKPETIRQRIIRGKAEKE